MNTYYFNINKVCNSNCKFCAADLEAQKQSHEFISLMDMQQIISKNGMKEHDLVILNGGEPTLNRDLIPIINYCKNKKMRVTLFTNGRKLKELDYTTSIIAEGIDRITIPIYGDTSERHDNITRAKGSFHDTITGLSHLMLLKKNFNFMVELKVLICKDNYQYESEVVKFLLDHFSMDVLLISGLIPSEDASINSQMLTKDQSKESINQILDVFFKKPNRVQLLIDGIPICHFTDKYRMMYLMKRKQNTRVYDRSEMSVLIDCDSKDEINPSTEIMSWNTNHCPKEDCSYKRICRLNTLQNHKEFLEGWIN